MWSSHSKVNFTLEWIDHTCMGFNIDSIAMVTRCSLFFIDSKRSKTITFCQPLCILLYNYFYLFYSNSLIFLQMSYIYVLQTEQVSFHNYYYWHTHIYILQKTMKFPHCRTSILKKWKLYYIKWLWIQCPLTRYMYNCLSSVYYNGLFPVNGLL